MHKSHSEAEQTECGSGVPENFSAVLMEQLVKNAAQKPQSAGKGGGQLGKQIK